MENQQEGNGKTTSAPPPDWYENEEGVLQWWDGKAWGPIAPEPSSASHHLPEAEISESGEPYNSFQLPSPVSESRGANGSLGLWSIVAAFVALLSTFLPDKAPYTVVPIVAAVGVILAIMGLVRAATSATSKKTAVWGLVLSGVMLVIGIGVSIGSQSSQSQAASSSSQTTPAPSTDTPVEQTSAEDQRNASMEEQGFHTWQSGEVWLKAADPESYTCDYGTRCIWYQLVSYSGCASGYYVKADILNANDVAIGWTNEITASVQPQDGVAFQLRSADNGGETIKLSEVSCMG